jgi:predicted dehydrogenase
MTSLPRPVRFGLVGTGHWARITHAPALASTEGVSSPQYGAGTGTPQPISRPATAHEDLSAFLDDVDAVAFAVPPDVQASIAVRAADAGKHLLLEKPITLSTADADALAEAVEEAQVASVVFFTFLFQADVRAWLADVAVRGGWADASAVWLGSALREASPYNTAWRRDKGALWDLAPHVISLLWTGLGPVTSMTADAGLSDVSHFVLHHQERATSAVTVTLGAPASIAGLELYLWGDPGKSIAPAGASDPVIPLRTALAELVGNIRSGQVTHPCDVQFGREVGRVLAEVQH